MTVYYDAAGYALAFLCAPIILPYMAVESVYDLSRSALLAVRDAYVRREAKRRRSCSRRRALSELDLTQCPTKSKVEENQRSSAFLSKLPLELRQAAYDLYYDGAEFNCFFNYRKTSSESTKRETSRSLQHGIRYLNPFHGHEYKCEGFIGGPMLPHQNRRYTSLYGLRREYGRKIEKGLLDLPLTCRQM